MKTIAFIVVLVLSNFAFPQQVPKSNTTRGQNQNNPDSNKVVSIHYQGIIEMGYGWGLGKWGQSSPRINIINGFRLPHYSLGIGMGVRGFYSNELEPAYDIKHDVYIPIFLDNRIYFSGKRLSPYLALGIGGAFGFGDVFESSFSSLFLNSSAGICLKISGKVALNIGIAFEVYKIEYGFSLDDFPYYDYTQEYTGSLGINAGISF